MTSIKLHSLNIRAYKVGFGECFLLSFTYANARNAHKERHMLIDFGSTGMPEGIDLEKQMMKVARDIKKRCNKKLDIVVATHRHKDHISGFATSSDGKGTGDIIASLEPKMIIRSWTEDPAALVSDQKAEAKSDADGSGQQFDKHRQSYIKSLQDMNRVAESILAEVKNLTCEECHPAIDQQVSKQIEFLADDNKLPNHSALENLRKMKGSQEYVYADNSPDSSTSKALSDLLPGVKITVLGPPTLEQQAEIQKQRPEDEKEFWILQENVQEFWKLQAGIDKFTKKTNHREPRLFPNAEFYKDSFPPHYRWFMRQIRAMRGEQLLSLVRVLDKAMNNTSVILLIEVGGKKLLFPGDAQIENWAYSQHNDEIKNLLKGVDVYKVGHHGSRNATPKWLWNDFEKKSDNKEDKERLKTLISTMEGRHGRSEETKVPRQTLVDALSDSSDYYSTEGTAEKDGVQVTELYIDVKIKLAG
jgi:hypothetical protein